MSWHFIVFRLRSVTYYLCFCRFSQRLSRCSFRIIGNLLFTENLWWATKSWVGNVYIVCTWRPGWTTWGTITTRLWLHLRTRQCVCHNLWRSMHGWLQGIFNWSKKHQAFVHFCDFILPNFHWDFRWSAAWKQRSWLRAEVTEFILLTSRERNRRKSNARKWALF